jgi:hypothetical protein
VAVLQGRCARTRAFEACAAVVRTRHCLAAHTAHTTAHTTANNTPGACCAVRGGLCCAAGCIGAAGGTSTVRFSVFR